MDAFAYVMIRARIDDYDKVARRMAADTMRRSTVSRANHGKPLTPKRENLMLVAAVQRNA